MLWVARVYAEGDTETVVSCVARRGVGDEFVVLEVPKGAGLLGSLAPASDAGHLVKGWPGRGRSYWRRARADEPTAVLHVTFEGSLQISGPVRGVEIGDDNLIFFELGMELAEVTGRRFGRSGDRDLEEAGLFELLL